MRPGAYETLWQIPMVQGFQGCGATLKHRLEHIRVVAHAGFAVPISEQAAGLGHGHILRVVLIRWVLINAVADNGKLDAGVELARMVANDHDKFILMLDAALAHELNVRLVNVTERAQA